MKGTPTLYQMWSNQTQALLHAAFILNRWQTAISEEMLTASVLQDTSLPLRLAWIQTKRGLTAAVLNQVGTCVFIRSSHSWVNPRPALLPWVFDHTSWLHLWLLSSHQLINQSNEIPLVYSVWTAIRTTLWGFLLISVVSLEVTWFIMVCRNTARQEIAEHLHS